MLSVADALRLVLQHAAPLAPLTAALDSSLLGLVLAEDVASDIDSPPYDKSMMDGYAVRSADVASGQATLSVVDEILAGATPKMAIAPGQAVRIMTGAPNAGRGRRRGHGRAHKADRRTARTNR